MENGTSKKKFNVVDLLIVILVICCLAGIAMRFLFVKKAPDPMTLPDVVSQQYQVTYIVRNLRGSAINYLTEGEEFRFYDTNKKFGTAFGVPDQKNAQKRYFDLDGNYVTPFNSAKVEKAQRFDLFGTFLCEGKLTEDNILVVDGAPTQGVMLNNPTTIRSDKMAMTIYITDIKPMA
ncbi:MAG: DUF4330 domain-containing protein [Clostridia bacterium]|nr:DUF4330 domain-containing protein [Clostridia bacterium]